MMMSIPQAALLLGVSTALLRKFCQQGRLGSKVGGRWVITDAELNAFNAIPRPPGYPKGRPRATPSPVHSYAASLPSDDTGNVPGCTSCPFHARSSR